jgi:hypothetical protein
VAVCARPASPRQRQSKLAATLRVEAGGAASTRWSSAACGRRDAELTRPQRGKGIRLVYLRHSPGSLPRAIAAGPFERLRHLNHLSETTATDDTRGPRDRNPAFTT